jgi:MFS family permease
LALSARDTILLTFATFGAIVGAHVGALPFIVKNADVTPYALGVVGALGMLSNIFAMSLGGWINRHFDHRSVLLIIVPLSFLAMAYTLVAQSLISFAASVMILSFMLGMCDLFMNAEGSIVEQESGKPIFSAYHGSASLGMAAFAILSSIISAWMAPWFVALFVIVPTAVTVAAIFKSIPTRVVEQKQENPVRAVLPYRILLFIGLAAGFNVACEGAAMIWAGQLLAETAPHLAAYSGLGLAFYGLCSGTMRMFGDRLRASYGDQNVMTIMLLVAIAGFAALSLNLSFAISVLAFACVGFGLSIVFPCLFALTGNLVPEGRAAAMSFVATVGGLPRVILPWVLGYIAAHSGLHAIFVACGLVAAGALAIIIFTFKQTQTKRVPPTGDTPVKST